MTNYISRLKSQTLLAAGALTFSSGMALADQVIVDDLIVQGSICSGQDCVNGESFGFDTLRLKENNLRIKAQDTSASASFPTVDWQLTFNDSSNGGENKFSVDNIDSSRTPFTILSSARTNAIFASDNRVGFGTSTPSVSLHAVDGNTPALRLEQNGSSGFTAQTFDIASNEANFFVRDVTNGSALPFRIQPGASTNAFYISSDNDIGMAAGTNPQASLHVKRTAGDATLLIEANNAGNDAALELETGTATWEFRSQESSGRLNVGLTGGNTPLKIDDAANNNLLKLGDNVNSDAVIVTGQLIVNGTPLNVPDYVFEDSYNLLPLAEVEAFIEANGHLPGVPSANTINTELRFNVVDMQLKLLEKVEELTLYTLEQQSTIAALQAEVETLKSGD
tara:strand:- start:669 stop:1850 length:1182 start_codon:yes stop_codon:yes gene_type:complete